MKRVLLACSVLLISAAVLVPVLRADVKTTDKSTFKLEGMMGSFMNRAAGGADGITSTVALKGNRMSRLNNVSGQIIDLTEEKVYTVDVRKKEYSVMTFAEMRAAMEQARAEAAKRQEQMNPQDKQSMQDMASKFEIDVKVDETGQRRPLIGMDTREVVMTLTMRQAGKTLEEGGGFVMTNTMWVAPKVAALDEMMQFNLKYFKAVFGGMFTGIDAQQAGALSAMMPGLGSLMEKMAVEGRKLQGTPLATTSVIETVKSQEQMDAAPKSSGGGGLGGMLANRMMKGRGGSGQQRTTTLTTTHETLSIGTTVSADDVAVPAGFKLVEKKK